MMDHLIQFKEWVISLGEKHQVNPLVLGSLYFISKLSFVTLMALTIKNIRAKKPVRMLILFAGISFSLPYVYLIIAGRNIPLWVYVFIIFIFIYCGYMIWRKVTAIPKPEDIA
jgi:fatty acid desaturase